MQYSSQLRVAGWQFTSEGIDQVHCIRLLLSQQKMQYSSIDVQYILPAMFSTNPMEKFFGQSRQCVGGNFYINVVDVISAAKVQRLHQLIKNDIIPTDDAIRKTCVHCEVDINEEDLNIVGEFNIDYAQELLNSTDTLKHKVVYIAGFLSRKHQPAFETDEVLSTEFLDELNRGGLSMPTLSTVHFVYCGMKLHELLSEARRNCRKYSQRLLYLSIPLLRRITKHAQRRRILYTKDSY